MEFIMAITVAAILGFGLGRVSTKYPSEMEMLNRLILAQAARRRDQWDTERLKNEIDRASKEVAREAGLQ